LVRGLKVVSLFDGIACGRVALDRAGYSVSSYAAFEIDKYARAISRYNYPDIEHMGDVLDVDFERYYGYDLVIGGSPCTFWSIAKHDREVDKNGVGWRLFMRFMDAVRQIQPRYYIYENVNSMPQTIKSYISEEFGREPIMINSALLSAQHRKRLYWTNIEGITQPEDKGILLKDILETGMAARDKSYCIDASYYKGISQHQLDIQRGKRQLVYMPVNKPLGAALRTRNDDSGKYKRLEVRGDEKLNALTSIQTDSVVCSPIRVGTIGKGGQGDRIYSVQGKTVSLMGNGGGRGSKTGLYKIDLADGDYAVRKLTTIEAERCQTLSDGYTALGIDDSGKTINISNTQRYKCIGNAWTVEIIAHIMGYMSFFGGGYGVRASTP
jgi:DNA (cytosine-5)-methyltransferase 3A